MTSSSWSTRWWTRKINWKRGWGQNQLLQNKTEKGSILVVPESRRNQTKFWWIGQGCQIFLGTTTQIGKNIPKREKYTK
jgi:hypothetical protein